MERAQLEAAAAGNHYLRGLLAIPVGVVLIVSGLGNMEWGPFRHLWTAPVVVLLAGAAYLAVTRYYNDSYGRVTLETGQLRHLVGSIGALLVMIGGPVVTQLLDLPVNGLGLAWAVVALGYYAVNVGLKPHHVVIWGSVLAASLVPYWGDPRTTDTPNHGLLMVGAAMLLTGTFDHRLLVRTFGSAKDLDLQNSDAGA